VFCPYSPFAVVIFSLNETKSEFVFGSPNQYPKGDEIESNVIHELNQINVAEKLFFIENCMFYDKSMKREPYIIKEVYYTQLKKEFDECTRVISELFKKRKIETVGYINTVESIETKKFENIYQKLMLLDELNLLDKICEVSENIVSSTQVSKIVAEIIGEPSNTTVARALQFFSESGKMKPKGKNNPFTEKNYGFLINKLMYLGLLKQVNNVSEKFADVLRNKG